MRNGVGIAPDAFSAHTPSAGSPMADEEMDEDSQPQESSAVEPASDMDWLRRHTKSALTLDSEEKAFEQSDSEPDEPNEPVSLLYPFPSLIFNQPLISLGGTLSLYSK